MKTTKNPRKRPVAGFICLLVAMSLFDAEARRIAVPQQARKGTQAVGLANWSNKDVRALTADLKSASSPTVELAVLPFTFKKKRHWGSAMTTSKRAVKQLLKGGKTVILTTHIWFDHGRDVDLVESSFSRAPSKHRPDEKAFFQPFTKRCQEATTAAEELRVWAKSRGLGNRLVFCFCPELEDDISSAASFDKALKYVGSILKSNAPRVKWFARRSLNGPQLNKHGGDLDPHRTSRTSLEIHDYLNAARVKVWGDLRAGDIYSPDGDWVYRNGREGSNLFVFSGGEAMKNSVLKSRAATLRGRKVSTLTWLPVFNGLHRSNESGGGYKHPRKRGTLYPLTKAQGQFKAADQRDKHLDFLKS